ncbi:LOW QUALITY PROTEIN: cadherin-like and PC-esterase domain-containing protein 1 [Pholidichthys leucotaenia]
MRCLLAPAGGLLVLLLRGAGALLRRRPCSGPLLLLLGVVVCLFYQTLVVARNRLRPSPQRPDRGRPSEQVLMETRRLIATLDALQKEAQFQVPSQRSSSRCQAVILMGRHPASDTEVQLYQRVLQQMDYEVQLSRYAETSSLLRTRQGGWSLLLCLSSAEASCLRRISFSHLQRHQMVNLLPGLMEAFSDAGGGLCQFYRDSQLTDLPMNPHSCGSTNQKLQLPQESSSRVQAQPSALVAMVNVYVLVTSVTPLTSFLHDICVVTTNQQQRGRTVKHRDFLLQHLGPTVSNQALEQIKKVIGVVLQSAVASANEKRQTFSRCVLCFQLFTFTLLFKRSAQPCGSPGKRQTVDPDITFSSLSDTTFDRQITKDQILEDNAAFLLPPHVARASGKEQKQYSGCSGTFGVCLSEDNVLLLLYFQQQLKSPSAFQLLYPLSSSSSSSAPLHLSDLLIQISSFYQLQTNSSSRADQLTNQQPTVHSTRKASCVDPHLRQIYTKPLLTLNPPFSPQVKEYRAEVTFDTVTVRIRPEPVSPACRVHLDEHRGPRMANYPVGLGNSRVSILVTDDSEPEPVVMTIYTIHVYRESRPSLPMFGDHVMCSFLQDCGLLVQPGRPCGLQPHISSQSPLQTCSSGHISGLFSCCLKHFSHMIKHLLSAPITHFTYQLGRWVVPCLSCFDNRTCDWREVFWQPDNCHYPLVDRPLLQDCMRDRKVLFIGDSTNRGMMYFLMERVNSSLEDWGKAHDMLVYRNLNRGHTQVSYSYYPQFWVEKKQRPTFREALLQLLRRSQPLMNSKLTVLVVGGVQWLNIDHLRTVREVLDRESLSNILVVVKSLGMGFHLPVDGIRSLSLSEIQNLYKENGNIISTAKHHGYEAIDTFSITMGRYKEFLQGRCACHFHEVEKFWSQRSAESSTNNTSRTLNGLSSQSTTMLDTELSPGSSSPTYHVRGPVNQVYSEIFLSRLCPSSRN